MEPVHVSKDDSFFVHDDDAIIMTCGKRLVKARSLLGYILAEYVDGDDADPTRTDCVDKYLMDALAKHHAYTAKSKATRSQRVAEHSCLSPPRPPRHAHSPDPDGIAMRDHDGVV